MITKGAQECCANAAVYEGCGASLGSLREIRPIFYHCDLSEHQRRSNLTSIARSKRTCITSCFSAQDDVNPVLEICAMRRLQICEIVAGRFERRTIPQKVGRGLGSELSSSSYASNGPQSKL